MATIILEVPHPHRFVIRARDDTGAITGKCDGPDIASVAIQHFSSAPVEASHTRTDLSSEPETIRVPSLENATDRHSQCGHSASSAPRPSRHPTPAQICHRARDDTGAITGKCDGPDIVSVAIQRLQLRARRGIPHPHRFVIEPETIRVPSLENATDQT
jgi:hypothetical protein